MWKINKKIEFLTTFGIMIFLVFSLFTIPVSSGEDIAEFEAPIEPISPEDGAYDVITSPELTVEVQHPENKTMNVIFWNATEDADYQIGNKTGVESGERVNLTWEGLDYGTTYEWYVEIEEIDEGETRTSDIWSFTTEHIPNKVREPLSPEDGATGITLNPDLEVNVSHPEGEDMWVIFYGGEKEEDKSYLGERKVPDGGTATITWKDLNYETTYEWYVILEEDVEEDPDFTTSETWTFTTETEKEIFELTINIDGEGTVEVDEEEVQDGWREAYEEGTEVAIEAIPFEGWRFEEWTGDYTGTEETIVIEMDDDKYLTAHFEEEVVVEEYELTINIDGEGTVEVDEEEVQDGWREIFEEGTDVTLKAISAEGWRFEEWTGTEETSEEITITMDQNKSITAHFEEVVVVDTYELTVKIEGEGTVNIDPDRDEYEEGTEVALTAEPNEGWKFVEWTGDYEGTEKEIIITMEDDKEITAHFDHSPSIRDRIEQEIREIPGFTSALLFFAAIFAVLIHNKKTNKK